MIATFQSPKCLILVGLLLCTCEAARTAPQESGDTQKGVIIFETVAFDEKTDVSIYCLLLIGDSTYWRSDKDGVKRVPVIIREPSVARSEVDLDVLKSKGYPKMLIEPSALRMLRAIEPRTGRAISPQAILLSDDRTHDPGNALIYAVNSWRHLIPSDNFGGRVSETSSQLFSKAAAAVDKPTENNFKAFFYSFMNSIVGIPCEVEEVSIEKGIISLKLIDNIQMNDALDSFNAFFTPP